MARIFRISVDSWPWSRVPFESVLKDGSSAENVALFLARIRSPMQCFPRFALQFRERRRVNNGIDKLLNVKTDRERWSATRPFFPIAGPR